jgi:hypothetical protein
VETREMQGGLRQTAPQTLTPESFSDHNGAQQRAIVVQLDGSRPNDAVAIASDDHRRHHLVQAVQRKTILLEQRPHRGQVTRLRQFNPHGQQSKEYNSIRRPASE